MNRSPRAHQQGFLLITVVLVLAVLAAMALMLSTSASLDNALVAKHTERANLDYAAEAGLAHAKWQLTQNTSCTGYTNVPSTAFADYSYSASVSPADGSPVSISAVGTLVATGSTRTLNRSGVKAYQAPESITLQPGPEGKDLFLTASQSARNYGDHQTLKVNSSDERTMLQFDLAALPASVRISSALMELYLAESPPGTVNAHRVTTEWIEGTCGGSGCIADGATWDTRDGSAPWSTPGGDYDPNPTASRSIGAAGSWYGWDISSLVAGWASGDLPNHGVLLKGADGVSSEWPGSDSNSSSLRPKLTINYTCECGVDCSPSVPVCDGNYAADVQAASWDTTAIGTELNDVAFVPGGVIINGVTIPADGGWAIVEKTNNDITITDLSGALLTTFTVTPTTTTGFAALHSISNGAYGPGLVLANVHTSPSGTDYIIIDLAGAIVTSWSHSAQASGVAWLASGSYQGHFLTINSPGAGQIFDETGTSVGTFTLPAEILKAGALVHLPDGNLVAVQDSQSDVIWITELSGSLPNITVTTVNSFDVNQFGIDKFKQGISLNPVNCNYALLRDTNEMVLVNQTGDAGLTVTLTPVEDAHIYQNSASSNYGSATQVRVGKDNSGPGGRWRSLLKFDGAEIATSLPVGANVTAATLRLYQENAVSTDTITMDVHEVTTDWAEGTITWNNSGPGGSFNATAEDTATVVLGTPGWTEWSLPLTLITDWMAFPSANFGVLVDTNGGKNRRADFVSRDHADTTRHPQLVIEYTEP